MSGSKAVRRSKGEGTYQTRASDQWVRLVVRKGKQQLAGPYKPNPTQARKAWLERHQKPSDRSQPSLSTFANSWIADIKGSPATLAQWQLLVANKIDADPIGDLKLTQVDDTAVRAWLSRQSGAQTTLRRNLGRLKQILAAAGVRVEVRRPVDHGHSRRPLTPREREAVAKVIANADDPTRRAILIAYYTGMRRSEICALKHSDVDGDGVWVQRRIIQTKGRLDEQTATKTAKSRAWVPLPDVLKEFLGKGKGYVLTDGPEPLSPVALTHRIKRAMKGTALEGLPYAGLHIFRRTYGMILLEAGVDVVTAAELMRHDPSMLMKEYARSREDLKRDAIKKAFGS
jgi:integrase